MKTLLYSQHNYPITTHSTSYHTMIQLSNNNSHGNSPFLRTYLQILKKILKDDIGLYVHISVSNFNGTTDMQPHAYASTRYVLSEIVCSVQLGYVGLGSIKVDRNVVGRNVVWIRCMHSILIVNNTHTNCIIVCDSEIEICLVHFPCDIGSIISWNLTIFVSNMYIFHKYIN